MVESDFLLGPVAGTILSLPLFDGGQRKAGVAQARAAYEESVANYRQTVLNAFREVENGLSDQRILDQQIQAQTKHSPLLVMPINFLIYVIEKVLLAILMSLILTALFCNKNN